MVGMWCNLHLGYSMLNSASDTDFGPFWTGLVDPNDEVCTNLDCVNKLKWDSDSSNFSVIAWAPEDYRVTSNSAGEHCFRYKAIGSYKGLNDKWCDKDLRYVCEFQCPVTTTSGR